MNSPENDKVSERIEELGSMMEWEGKARISSGYPIRVDHFWGVVGVNLVVPFACITSMWDSRC